MEKFKVGDVVRLKSGSPDMTVLFSDSEDTKVTYYNFALSKFSAGLTLPTEALESVN